jgi:hypothetical protein
VRVPWISDDGDAGFVVEGTPIDELVPEFSETIITTGRIAALGKFSRRHCCSCVNLTECYHGHGCSDGWWRGSSSFG